MLQSSGFALKVVHAISAEELRMTMNIGTRCAQRMLSANVPHPVLQDVIFLYETGELSRNVCQQESAVVYQAKECCWTQACYVQKVEERAVQLQVVSRCIK